MPVVSYTIPALDCPAEEAVIRNRLGRMPGVTGLSFDLFNRRLTVEHILGSDGDIVAALKDIGMSLGARNEGGSHTHASGHDPDHPRDANNHSDRTPGRAERIESKPGGPVATAGQIGLLAASGALAFAAEIVAWQGGAGSDRSWPVIALAVASILLGGLPTLRKGLIALRTLTLNINFLMTVAVLGAAGIGSWPEAAMVVFLFAVAELIESYSLERARNAVRALMTLTPDTASVQSEGEWIEMDAAGIPSGSTVRVKPGARVPLDGTLSAGSSAVDQAPITGESIPVEKGVGDRVFAGTINGNGLLEIVTTGGKDETTLARIIRTIQEAQGQRAPTQRFVDSFARIYTPVVCVVALLVAVAPPLAFAQPWMPWLYRALVLLVVGCPCALVISTPVTIVSGLAAAAKRGILIKGGVHLEQGRLIRALALDKTGTITEGRPRVTDVRSLGPMSPDHVLRIAASLDGGSDHPVARAVTSAWTEVKVKQLGPLLSVERSLSIPGRGASGVIDGREFFVGNHRLAHERGVCSPTIEALLEELEVKGQTAIVLADNAQALGVLAVADTPRPSSIAAVRELHALGIRTIMLSGDNQTTSQVVAQSVGIDDGRGNLLPEDKLRAINDLLAEYGSVGMVGDGVNDAPALARATVGFAMGAAGTDTALETADVALMRDDLRGVPQFVILSRRTAAILRQNICLALGAKSVFFVLAVLGVATMWMAVLADVGATLIVIANGLRLVLPRRVAAPLGAAAVDGHAPPLA